MTLPTAAQIGAVLEAAHEAFRPFVALCAFAGLRLGEAAGLRVEDIDFLRRTQRGPPGAARRPRARSS
jgi:integrase